MTQDHAINRYLTRYPLAAVAVYVGVVVMLLFAAWVAVADMLDRRNGVAAATEMLARLEGRNPTNVAKLDSQAGPVPTGSPFLEGQTLTVAGAALLQRVASSITRLGGNVLSSQVELEGAEAKNGFIGIIASCEIEQSALQQLLYDLEAGMPFLFVDQLVAQAPVPTAAKTGERMRVLIAVSGLWPGDKSGEK
jgi:general secretion pathway protein M